MSTLKMIFSLVNFLWRGVLMLWEVASAMPLVTAAFIVVVAVAVVFLIAGR